MTRAEQELVGDYEMAALTLKRMVQHVGLNAESVCEDWDTPIGSLGLILAENYLKQRDAFSQFRALWSAYRQALSVPFSLDRTEDERIKTEVERCYDQLNKLAKEG